MRVKFGTRALALGVGVGSLLGVSLAMPAAAALKPSVTCSKLSASTTIKGSNATTKSAYSGCTPAALAAGGASNVTTPAKALAGKITETITWKNGEGTTTVSQGYAGASGNGKCAKGTSRIKLTGSVTSSTGAAAKVIKNGEPITGFVCANESKQPYTTTLEPGTKLTL
jgi:hypothetical protein